MSVCFPNLFSYHPPFYVIKIFSHLIKNGFFSFSKSYFFLSFFFILFNMYNNMQFQHSTYPDQYDISNDNKAVFPSPMTNASLDSPPNNKINQNYMPLGSSPKPFTNNSRVQQYDVASYTSNFNNNNQSISISTNNNNNNSDNNAMLISSPTSPNQQQQYNTNDNMSESLISPTSPNSLEDEILQRK